MDLYYFIMNYQRRSDLKCISVMSGREDRGESSSYEYESTAELLRKALAHLEAEGRLNQMHNRDSNVTPVQPQAYLYPRPGGLLTPPRHPRPAQLLLQNSRRTEPTYSRSDPLVGTGQRDYAGPSTSANSSTWSDQQPCPGRSQYRQAPLSAFPGQLQMRDRCNRTVGGDTNGATGSSQNSGTSEEYRKDNYYFEHRRLFGGYSGYQPSQSVSTRYRTGSAPFTTHYTKLPSTGASTKGKSSKRMVMKHSQGSETSRLILWKKEVVCLRSKNDGTVPNVEEKIALAKLGLLVKEVKFDMDGDYFHLDAVLKAEYPDLEFTGGYCLMRPLSNSRDLTIIGPPKGGFTVRYLKDILRSARLYVSPLQEDIRHDEEDEADQSQEYNELHEYCKVCNELFPLTELQKHVEECTAAGSSVVIEGDSQKDQPQEPLVPPD